MLLEVSSRIMMFGLIWVWASTLGDMPTTPSATVSATIGATLLLCMVSPSFP